MSIEQNNHNENLKRIKAKYKILVAEDNDIVRRLLRYTLVDRGYQCDAARNGNEALGLWHSGHYDLVILDDGMPDISGKQVCAAIRMSELHSGKRTPIIMLTAQSREYVGDVDIDGFIQKPPGKGELDEMIYWLLTKEN